MRHVRKNPGLKRKVIITLLFVLILCGIVWAGKWWLDKREQPGTIPVQKTNQDGSAPEKQVTPDSNVPGGSDNDRGDSGKKLSSPSGTFVSHHRPSLSGSNGSSTLFSSCVIETPGAVCSIRFTQWSVTRELEKKTVDSDNTASWQWNINDIEITVGSWTVEAVASYNNQQQVTKDPIKLEVQP